MVGEIKEKRLFPALPPQESDCRLGLLLDPVVLGRVWLTRGGQGSPGEIVVSPVTVKLAPIEIAKSAGPGTVGQFQPSRNLDPTWAQPFEWRVLTFGPPHADLIGLEMPFADHAGRVAGGAQAFGDRLFLKRKGSLGDRIESEARKILEFHRCFILILV